MRKRYKKEERKYCLREGDMKIALIGPYPPPYGGRSVHIQRLKEQLEKRGVGVVVYSQGGLNFLEQNIITIKKGWLLQYFFSAEEDIIHYHKSNWIERSLIGLMSFLGKKVVITIHSNEFLKDDIMYGNWIKKKVIIFALKHTHFIIADNKSIKDFVIHIGINQNKVSVIPAFIPPAIREEHSKKIPNYVWDFVESHKPIISGNAFTTDFYKGIDVYGIDLCVALIYNLKKKYPSIGLVFCLPSVSNYEYFKKIQEQIKKFDIEDNILFITEPLPEVYPIWMKSDIFVRPTCTDGDALSIREAMYLKIPVVTSDAVPRPEGVVLFKNRDVQDFIEKTKKVLNNYEEYKNIANKLDPGNGFDKILEVYNELAK